jgi:hypothetical protein
MVVKMAEQQEGEVGSSWRRVLVPAETCALSVGLGAARAEAWFRRARDAPKWPRRPPAAPRRARRLDSPASPLTTTTLLCCSTLSSLAPLTTTLFAASAPLSPALLRPLSLCRRVPASQGRLLLPRAAPPRASVRCFAAAKMASAEADKGPMLQFENVRTWCAPALLPRQLTETCPQTGKRDRLTELEKTFQAEWAAAKHFEVDSPMQTEAGLEDMSPEEIRAKYPKMLFTFPYAYANGSLHLGHAFSLSKVEFATGYERMRGKRALFPWAFHCTGMPIPVSALQHRAPCSSDRLAGVRRQAQARD